MSDLAVPGCWGAVGTELAWMLSPLGYKLQMQRQNSALPCSRLWSVNVILPGDRAPEDLAPPETKPRDPGQTFHTKKPQGSPTCRKRMSGMQQYPSTVKFCCALCIYSQFGFSFITQRKRWKQEYCVCMKTWQRMSIFPFVFSESWSGSCSSHYYLCKRESNWFFQALHDAGNQYLVPEAQWHKPWRFLIFKPSFSWYLDVCSPSLPWSQLCPLCHCKVRQTHSFRCIHINYLSSHRCYIGFAK